MKMLIDLWMDGYDNDKQMKDACIAYVQDQLDSTGTSVKVLWVDKVEGESNYRLTKAIDGV